MSRRLPSLLAVGALLAASVAAAHTPARLLADTPFTVPNPTDSYALFGKFDTGRERFVVRFSHPQPFAAPLEIFVPHEAGLANHRPAYALVGPGLPAPSAEERAALPLPLPAGWGAIVELNQVSPRPVFFETVLRRFYWSSGAMAVVWPAGASEVWVWSPAGTPGKFGLGFGVEEGGGYLDAFKDWTFYAY